jgi:hypothetical protein
LQTQTQTPTLWLRHLPSPSVVATRQRRAPPCTQTPANHPSRPRGPLRDPLGARRDGYLIPVPPRRLARGACHAPPSNGSVRPTPAARAVELPIPLSLNNKDGFLALAPKYQESLLASIQRFAVFLRIETEPTWTTLRQEVFAQINIQRLLGSMLASVSSIIVSIIVVFLYATFLLVERRAFPRKIENISIDASRVARIQTITADINRRIGSYLALKTIISLFLGAISWVIMAFVGLEFAAFWAVLIAFMNFVPYIG